MLPKGPTSVAPHPVDQGVCSGATGLNTASLSGCRTDAVCAWQISRGGMLLARELGRVDYRDHDDKAHPQHAPEKEQQDNKDCVSRSGARFHWGPFVAADRHARDP